MSSSVVRSFPCIISCIEAIIWLKINMVEKLIRKRLLIFIEKTNNI